MAVAGDHVVEQLVHVTSAGDKHWKTISSVADVLLGQCAASSFCCSRRGSFGGSALLPPLFVPPSSPYLPPGRGGWLAALEPEAWQVLAARQTPVIHRSRPTGGTRGPVEVPSSPPRHPTSSRSRLGIW